MNTPEKIMKAKTLKTSSVPGFGVSTYIADKEATPAQLGSRDLYIECCRQMVRADDFGIHVLMMRNMKGASMTLHVDGDSSLTEDVAALTGAKVAEGDMVVMLGEDLLNGDLSEDEMMEVALADIARHIDHCWPVADKSTGWLGSHLGWATVAAVIAGAHAVLRMFEPADAVMSRIKDAAGKVIVDETRFRHSDARLAALQNRPALEAVENVCDQAFKTHGDYLSLPAKGAAIADAAKSIFMEAVDCMVTPPKTIV